MVTVVVSICLVTRDLCLGQTPDSLTAGDLCLGQTRDCLTARDLCLGQVWRCHCLNSCIKGRMYTLGFICQGTVFCYQDTICVKDRMYTLGFGQVLCFQAVLYRWDMLGFIFGLADNGYC